MQILQANQPDLILTLDTLGVVQDIAASQELSTMRTADWLGRSWADTCERASAAKTSRLIETAKEGLFSGYSQINQRFPDGSKMLFEFVAVLTNNEQQQITAIGKNLSTVVSMQNKLLQSQQDMEREFWQNRELETRYRALVNTTPEAVIIVRDPDRRIVDCNANATKMVRLNIGDELATLRLSDEDDIKVGKALDIAKSAGAAPLIIVQAANQRWMLRVSSFEGNSGKQYILQFSRYESLGASKDIEPITGISLSDIISHLPEGMVAVNTQDIITHANPAFAALVNHDNSKNMLGQPIDQWLQVPGKNASSIWGKLQREDRISNFTSRIDTPSSGYDVSISARRVASANSELMLMLIRPLAA